MTNEALTSWCVYLLRCADDSLYCGITNDLAKRIATHNTGKGARYTRVRLPVVVAYVEPCADRSEASKREAAIKLLSRSSKLALIANQGEVALVLQTNPA
ncbi:GIY-YIG nuclease family protein [Chitinimonas sp. BJB300]|uniref:GIY-YIG nuclease family protein n=1 Tax=Chitinimonas sp. BJB300 TaxID=1559339 RepID=UPI000C0E51F9|nr:GIY-YIG nuclease family protein [Chitinimonas sp. BJB300]PHV13408.1 endonuclease [Chitinimonas sp. BJB300]TSJ89728.1 GIY-YIG nuclease family protein [Chitinimonas sp. BJB300]